MIQSVATMRMPAPSSPAIAHLSRMAFAAILVLVYLFGSWAAFRTSIASDTEMEQNTLRVNLNAVSGLLHGDTSAYLILEDFGDKYYGIGFHAPAYPIQILLYPPVARLLNVDHETAFLLVKHWLAFSLFFASGFFVFSLARRASSDPPFSALLTLGYLLWPYLLGHAALNVKDIPFLFAWLLCTHLSFGVMASYGAGQPIRQRSALFLGICTGWLISIRISGGLIFFQYLLSLLWLWRFSRQPGQPSLPSLSSFFRLLPLFLGSASAFVFLAYPVFWHDPMEFFQAIRFMNHHPMGYMGTCSLVYGRCLPVTTSPSPFYIPLWLSVKLPLLVIAGWLFLPFALRKIRFTQSSSGFILVLAMTAFLVPLILIASRATLYNELRQVLFLMPMFYISGVFSLYWLSRKIALTALVIACAVFSIDNFLAFPYQYIWFNEATRLLNVTQKFDTDYWGASDKNAYNRLAAFIKARPSFMTRRLDATRNLETTNQNKNTYARLGEFTDIDPTPNCLYAEFETLTRYVEPRLFNCLRFEGEATASSPRPFFLVTWHTNTPRMGNCAIIGQEAPRLFMGNGKIRLMTVWHCQ